jgi:hypothetical protein
MVPGVSRAQKASKLSPMDYEEIRQLYARYNMAFDSNDAKLLETVFTPDGTFTMGAGNSRQARTMIAPNAVKTARPQVRHMATSITITPSPEGARGTSYLMLVNGQSTPPSVMGTGYYEDELVKTPDGWRFKSRIYYSQSAPAAAPPQTSSR